MNRWTINQRQCSVEGCNRKHKAKGWCHLHYKRSTLNGDLNLHVPLGKSFHRPAALLDYLLQHRLVTDNECWVWTGYCDIKGYGHVKVDGKIVKVHRISAIVHELLPPGSRLHVLHHCDNPPCFNPAHLFAGTNADNVRDRVRKGRNWRNQVRGAHHGRRKLTAEQVSEIRQFLSAGMTAPDIATRYDVHFGTIYDIKSGRHWKDS